MNTRQGTLIGASLVGGFSVAVAMWVVAFIGHLPALASGPPAVRVIAMLITQVVGAFLIGRAAASSGVAVGAGAGLVTGCLNLLILGSVIAQTDPDEHGIVTGAAGFILGYIVLSLVLGTLGGLLGARLAGRSGEPATTADWLARMGLTCVVAIVPLLFVGGLVTSSASGMAFPDWPTSGGRAMFLYPLSLMTSDYQKFYEHSHRLFGALVGLSVAALLVLTFLADSRRAMRAVVAGLFLLVVAQGLLGAGRVLERSPAIGLIHGVLGQLTFALAVGIAAALSRGFKNASSTGAPTVKPVLVAWLLAALIFQLALGAAYRHLQHKHIIFLHAVTALIPTILAAIVGFSAGRGKAGSPTERLVARLGKGVIHATNLQWALGLGALWAVMVFPNLAEPHTARIVLGTVHQFNGAVILACAVLTGVWAYRLQYAAAYPAAQPAVRGT